MSKHRSHKPTKKKSRPRDDAFDGAIYFTVAFLGAVLTVFGFLLTKGKNWAEVLVLYVAVVVVLTNVFAFQAYQGAPLKGWRAALARLPLRPAGFGSRHGRPLEAAHQASNARSAILISTALGVVLVTALAVILIPGLL